MQQCRDTFTCRLHRANLNLSRYTHTLQLFRQGHWRSSWWIFVLHPCSLAFPALHHHTTLPVTKRHQYTIPTWSPVPPITRGWSCMHENPQVPTLATVVLIWLLWLTIWQEEAHHRARRATMMHACRKPDAPIMTSIGVPNLKVALGTMLAWHQLVQHVEAEALQEHTEKSAETTPGQLVYARHTHTHTTIALGCRNSWHGTAPVATETVYISPNCSHLCTNASHIYACSHPASCLQCPAVAQRNEIRILTHVPGNTTTHILIPKSSIPWRRIGRLKKETVS